MLTRAGRRDAWMAAGRRTAGWAEGAVPTACDESSPARAAAASSLPPSLGERDGRPTSRIPGRAPVNRVPPAQNQSSSANTFCASANAVFAAGTPQ